jgi:hypothetical protein
MTPRAARRLQAQLTEADHQLLPGDVADRDFRWARGDSNGHSRHPKRTRKS